MSSDTLVRDLTSALEAISLIDPHSHIDPLAPVSKSLDDILGYHYYTELAHSAGMSKDVLKPDADPRERVREIVRHMDRYDNTVQYSWFLDIARTFLGFTGKKIAAADADPLFDAAQKTFACDGDAGVSTFIASVIPPVAMPQFLGMSLSVPTNWLKPRQ